MIGPMRFCGFLAAQILVLMLFLSGCSSRSPNRSSEPAYEGYRDITNCDAILGWAWDANRPHDPIEVDVYEGNTLIATVKADEFRKDLVVAGKGNGKHGLYFPIPPRLRDGRPRSFSLKYGGTQKLLTGGTVEMTCTIEP
jgi:hypothetical protein